MQSLFSPDSKIMQALSRLADLVILNLLFVLTCLPIVPIGASLTAMYTVCFRMGTDREEGVFRCYFRAFRQNFKQSTLLWLFLLFFGIVSGLSIFLFSSQTGSLRYLTYVYILFLFLILSVASHVFPLLSQFDNTITGTIKNALLFSVGYLPRTLVMLVIWCLPFVLILVDLYLFLQVGFLWFFLCFALGAYGTARLLRPVYAPFMEPQQEDAL